MSQETRRAIAFIGGGCLLAGAIGFGVWQVSDPANFSTASQVHEAGHTQTETATVTETTSASENTARAGAATRDTSGQNANDNSAATQEHSRHRSTPHSLADAHGLPTTPRGSQNSRRAQIDAADPFLPPHAVIKADPKPVEPTVVYRPRGFEGPQPQQQGSQRGAGNQEPNDSLVLAEPAPAADRHNDTSADGTGPGVTVPNTANQGAARNGVSGQASIQQAPVEVPQAIHDLTTLDPKPLLNETLDRAGLQPGAGTPVHPAQAGQPSDAGEPNDTAPQDQQHQQDQRLHQNEQTPEPEAGTAAWTGQIANVPASAELHDALARGTAAANEAAQQLRDAVDEFVGAGSAGIGSTALSSSSSAFRAH